MNIFATSDCPEKSAKNLDDKRVIKMILECAQLMSSAAHIHGVGFKAPYKKTHVNHPVAVWTRECVGNYRWVLKHFTALCSEYFERYNKIHKCLDHIVAFYDISYDMPAGELRPFVNCARNTKLQIDYTHVEDTVLAYQLYLNDRWNTDKREPTWYGVKHG